MLLKPLGAPLYVSNGPGTLNSVGIVFNVLPNLGPNLQISALNVTSQDMAWDAARARLYVTGTGSAETNGSSIVVVDTAASMVVNAVYAGSQPSSVGLSDDGHYLYAGFQSLSAMRHITLPDLALDLTIPIQSSSACLSYATDVKAAPGHPETFAVTMGNRAISPPDDGGIAVFDNAIQRTQPEPPISGKHYKIAWGKDATRFYTNTAFGGTTIG